MNSATTKLPLNWTYIIFVILVAIAGVGFIAYAITMQTYLQWAQGLPISGGWTWPRVFAADLFCLLMLWALIWKIYCDANTEIGSEQLSQPSVFSRRTIRWNEVTGVKVFGAVGYHILSGRKKIVVTSYAYSNPIAVISMLHARVQTAVPNTHHGN